MACVFGHKWNGCKCEKCGKVRDTGHSWDGCVCKTCGKQTEFVTIDCLDSDEIGLFVGIVGGYTERSLNSMTQQQASEAKELFGRLEAAARVTPFQLIKEDLKTACLYNSTAICYGWLRTKATSSGVQDIKFHVIQEELIRRKAMEVDRKLTKLIR